MPIKPRIDKLRQILAENNIEAILVSQPDNLYYLSGCEGLEGYLLITGREAILATDFRYIEQAQRQSPDYQIFKISGKMADWMPRWISGMNIRNLGFESGFTSFTSHKLLNEILEKARLSINLIPLEGIIETIRMIKDPEEIEMITRAAEITDAVYLHVDNIIRDGMTEKALAWEIEKFMRENGSQPVPFDLIVAAGPNAALPHAKPSDYIIRTGDPVVIDIGARYNYYGSDMTRTFCAGKPNAEFRKIYDIVLNAQMAAISQIKPGMTGSQADAIAREVITQNGYGEAFGHGLGHGIGLVTHEKPHLGYTSTDILTNGMAFTIEPGIYLSGWGGVRIEDDVVIENDTLRVISSARK